MTDEWAIVSPHPITLAECALGAATVDPDLGIASLWDGGAVLLSRTDGAQLTVTGSRVLEYLGDAERILGTTIEATAGECWTDLRGRGWHADEGAVLVAAIASAARGRAHQLGTDGKATSYVELQD